MTATETVTLTITTVSGLDTAITINEDPDDANALSTWYSDDYTDDNYGSTPDETMTYTFEAGKTYYIAGFIYSSSNNGELTVTITVG